MNFLTSTNYCKLQLNHNGNYLADQPIDGKVHINFECDLQCRGIKVKLQCIESTSFNDTESYNDGSGEQRSRPAAFTGENEIFSNLLWVYGEQNGLHTLQPGRQTFPFEFHLPSNIPGSCQLDYGKIVYKITATVDIPFAMDYEDNIIIHLKSPVDLNLLANANDMKPSYYSNEKTVGFCCWAEGEITMEVELPQRVLISNKEMPVVVKLINMSNANVCLVELELQEILTFKATEPYKNDRHVKSKLIKLDQPGIGAHCEHTFTFIVKLPENMPLPNFAQSTLMCSRYQYKVTVVLPSGHMDLVLKIPIVVGDIPLIQETAETLSNPQPTGNIGWINPVEQFNPSAPPLDAATEECESPPPPYESLGF